MRIAHLLGLSLFTQALFSQPYIITTVAGTDRLLDNHAATSAPLRSPTGVAVDAAGNLYIADRDDNRVRKISPSNVITTFAGTGLPGYTGDRGKATQARLDTPTGLAIDAQGNVYIADRGNFVVRRVSPDGTINTVAGNGIPGFSGDKSTATSAEIMPWAVAVDPQGNLYIADGFNYRVRKVDTKGIITTIGGNGNPVYSGDAANALTTSIDLPTGIAVDATGNVYIASFERVLEIDTTGAISTVAGSGDFGFIIDGVDARKAVMLPGGVLLDGKGSLYLTDFNLNKVRKVDLSTHIISAVAGNGTMGFSGDQNSAPAAELSIPYALALDASNNLFVSDLGNGRIRKVSNAIISTVAGTAIGDGAAATSAFLNLPTGLAVDGSNNIVIADAGNYSARKFSPGGAIASFGQLQPFSTPFAVAADAAANFYVTDDEPRVLKITSAGATSIIAGNGTDGYTGDGGQAVTAAISQPSGIAVDSASNIYITDSTHNRIRKISSAGVINTIAGNGSATFSGDNGPATKAGMDPADIAVDSKGNLYVADELNCRIRKIALDGTITTVAGTGVPGYSGDGGLATAAKLAFPTGVAVDPAGNLYIADSVNFVIRRVNVGGLITTIAGNGTFYPSSGDGGPAASAQMNPFHLTVDSLGNVFFTDLINDRIRKLAPQPIIPGSITIVSGNGQTASSGSALTQPLVVKVTDRTGAGLAGVIVNFTVTPSDGAKLTLASAITVNDGTASTSVTLGSTAGPVTITAAVTGITNVTFTETVLSATAPSITTGGVVSAGLSTPAVAALSVDSIATVFGSQFAAAGTALQIGPADLVNGKVPTVFGGVCVLFGTARAPIFGVYANQINLQVPQAGPGQVNVQVITGCDTPQAQTSNTVTAQIQAAAPEFFYFTHTANGKNAIAAVNAVTNGYVGAPGLISGGSFTPASHGDYLTLYATGFGDTNPSFGPGELPAAAASITGPYTISFGGVTLSPSDILYVGVTQNAGVYQVNIRVPDTVPAGDQPFIITIGGVSSPSGAYITVASN